MSSYLAVITVEELLGVGSFELSALIYLYYVFHPYVLSFFLCAFFPLVLFGFVFSSMILFCSHLYICHDNFCLS